MTHNTADRKSIRNAEKLARQADIARGEFIKWLMESVNGRAWVNNLLTSCHIFHNPMNDSDRWTSFALGEMNVGQKILADIMLYCPERYVEMQREHYERSLSRNHPGRNHSDDDRNLASEYVGSEDGGWDDQGSVTADDANVD